MTNSSDTKYVVTIVEDEGEFTAQVENSSNVYESIDSAREAVACLVEDGTPMSMIRVYSLLPMVRTDDFMHGYNPEA